MDGTDGWMNRQRDQWTDGMGRTEGWNERTEGTDGWIYGRTDELTDGQIERTDGTDERTDGRIGGTDGWMVWEEEFDG